MTLRRPCYRWWRTKISETGSPTGEKRTRSGFPGRRLPRRHSLSTPGYAAQCHPPRATSPFSLRMSYSDSAKVAPPGELPEAREWWALAGLIRVARETVKDRPTLLALLGNVTSAVIGPLTITLIALRLS